MLLCKLIPPDWWRVLAISFVGNSNFENKLRLYTFKFQFMYENVNFSFLLWNKLYLYFVTFLLRACIFNKFLTTEFKCPKFKVTSLWGSCGTCILNFIVENKTHHQNYSINKDMSGNVWNRPSGCFMVDMGISSNIMKSASPKCCMTIWDMVIYSDTLNWSDITPIFEPITELDLITNFDLITKFREVSIEHCNGCG